MATQNGFKTSFTLLEEAKEEYKKVKELYNSMVGTLYKSILYDTIITIQKEIEKMKIKESEEDEMVEKCEVNRLFCG